MLSVLLEATHAGAAVLQHYFGGTFTVENKEGVNNLVTQADTESEAAIMAVIRKNYPDH
ncbi:MAG TPA: inositol monophosphatase, partial [Chitinophagaceae bacterium]|nr:inositol monophosphatase [Chitinophagaceae bacterium]